MKIGDQAITKISMMFSGPYTHQFRQIEAGTLVTLIKQYPLYSNAWLVDMKYTYPDGASDFFIAVFNERNLEVVIPVGENANHEI